jgi:general stress protein YciG
MERQGNSRRGFALLDPQRLKELRRRGGQMVQRLGKAYAFTQEAAREAGKKGGRAVSRDRAHMAKIGHRGAVSPRRQRAEAKDQPG